MAGDWPAADTPEPDQAAAAARQRLKGFGTHLVLYFVVLVVLVPVNFLMTPENPWFVLPMVGWGAVLALHAAHVMGFFDALRRKAR